MGLLKKIFMWIFLIGYLAKSFVNNCEAQILLKKGLEEKALRWKLYKVQINSTVRGEELEVFIIHDGLKTKITEKNLTKNTTKVYLF